MLEQTACDYSQADFAWPCYRVGMNNPFLRTLIAHVLLLAMCGCQAPKDWRDANRPLDEDRQAILSMAGTFAVSFNFEEVLAVREGYELHEPYATSADELVVVVADKPGYVSLQHLLVVRHGDEVHVINHWRQDWLYEPKSAWFYSHDGVWSRVDLSPELIRGQWVQTVYNVADSPRYSSVGSWRHNWGVSSWSGSPAMRPLPLREKHLEEQYDALYSRNTHTVSETGWLHLQDNLKFDPGHATQPVLSIEQGVNRYAQISDEGFEKAHDYWKNTEAYWKLVRSVWAEVLADRDTLRLRDRWKGDALFSHLFGLADEYWGQSEVSEARPRIKEVIDAFVVEDKSK